MKCRQKTEVPERVGRLHPGYLHRGLWKRRRRPEKGGATETGGWTRAALSLEGIQSYPCQHNVGFSNEHRGGENSSMFD